MARPAAEWERLPGRGAGARLCDFLVLPFFWIMTGVISLTTGNRSGAELMLGTGAGAFSAPSVAAGAVADMILGMLIARRPTVRLGLWGAIAVAGSFSPPVPCCGPTSGTSRSGR